MSRAGAPQDGTVALASIRGTTDARTVTRTRAIATMSADVPAGRPARPRSGGLDRAPRCGATRRTIRRRPLPALALPREPARAGDRAQHRRGRRARGALRDRAPDATGTGTGPVATAFSLNAVVRSGHQRAGHFRTNGLAIYDEAPSHGMKFVVGVTNEKSTGAVVKYMGWRLVGPLPVRVLHPVRRAEPGVRHVPVDGAVARPPTGSPTWPASSTRHPADGLTNRYDLASLRWRLACPAHRLPPARR